MPAAAAHDVPITTDKPLDYVKLVAAANGLDWRTLWGVFGTESNYGQDPNAKKPNRVGALGDFQFLPATWRKYGTANPADRLNFGHSVNAAARYLHALGADGDVNSQATATALNHYSGGGGSTYITSVKSKGNDTHSGFFGGTTFTPIPGGPTIDPGAIKDTATSVGDAVGQIAGFLTNPQTWLRLVEIVLGVALLLMGLKSFTGGAIDPVGAAASVAKVVP